MMVFYVKVVIARGSCCLLWVFYRSLTSPISDHAQKIRKTISPFFETIPKSVDSHPSSGRQHTIISLEKIHPKK